MSDLKSWLVKLNSDQAASDLSVKKQYFSEALELYPRSYKLWIRYLNFEVDQMLDRSNVVDTVNGIDMYRLKKEPPVHWTLLNDLFERSLVLLNRFPGVWKLYAMTLLHQNVQKHTADIRRVFNRALQALPITQHNHIWPYYCAFGLLAGGYTCVIVWKRYCQYDSSALEDFYSVLLDQSPKRYTEAACLLASLLELPHFQSKYGKTSFDMWLTLCDLVCEHAEQMHTTNGTHIISLSDYLTQNGGLVPRCLQANGLGNVCQLDVERLLMRGIKKFGDLAGKLWTDLARFHILRGQWHLARSTFTEALDSVGTMRDFTLVFDSFLEFEESLLSAQMDTAGADDVSIDMAMSRLEWLIAQRPFLQNSLYLRRNPFRVLEWERRVDLYLDAFPGNPAPALAELEKAISAIPPKKVDGRLCDLYLKLIGIYAELGDEDKVQEIYERAVAVPYQRIDELIRVWTSWIERELVCLRKAQAHALVKRATHVPANAATVKQTRFDDEATPPQTRLFKSLRLWGLYADLEEMNGTFLSTCAVYEQVISLKIANPVLFVHYAAFAEENSHFELMYRIYERAIDMFGFPAALDFWLLYLSKFVSRFGGSKLERTRDMFEQAIQKCPAHSVRFLFLFFAQFEEEHGLTRRAMQIYSRCAQTVPRDQRYFIYRVYLGKVKEHFRPEAMREVYQQAIEAVPESDARTLCLRFSALETELEEIDRARAVYAYGAQFTDPDRFPEYWDSWKAFEIEHGNEQTFKEMLRIKKSVKVRYSTAVKMPAVEFHKAAETILHPMEQLDKTKSSISFVKGSSGGADGANQEEMSIEF